MPGLTFVLDNSQMIYNLHQASILKRISKTKLIGFFDDRKISVPSYICSIIQKKLGTSVTTPEASLVERRDPVHGDCVNMEALQGEIRGFSYDFFSRSLRVVDCKYSMYKSRFKVTWAIRALRWRSLPWKAASWSGVLSDQKSETQRIKLVRFPHSESTKTTTTVTSSTYIHTSGFSTWPPTLKC